MHLQHQCMRQSWQKTCIHGSVTPFTMDRLRELVRHDGPCITVFLPARRPGEQALHSTTHLLRNLTQDAAHQLATSPDDLFQPLRALAEDPKTDQGCHWPRVLLRAPDVFETVFLRSPAAARVYTGRYFYVLPLLEELCLPPEFYVLKISRKDAALLRAQFTLEPVPFPARVPATLDEFLELERPDHDLENRNAAGPGPNRRIRFGTGAERETAHLADYYRALDRAMHETIRDAPLILLGVEEDTALYHSISADPNLAADALRDSESVEQGYAILRARAMKRTAEMLAESSERLSPARFTRNLEIASAAASEGRVARLFVRAGEDDAALNDSAVETLRHGGEVFPVSAESLGDARAAAMLRY